MILKTRETFDSQIHPGVKFTVRVLSDIQRARRDAKVMAERMKYGELSRRASRLFKEAAGDEEDKEKSIAAVNASPQADEIARLQEEANLIYKAHILPNALEAGFVSIEGITAEDGSALALPALIESAPKDLLEEIALRCEQASGISEPQQKN